MPVAVHHAVLFTVAFVLLTSLLLSVVYTIVVGMLTDAYRYESFLEKANEKLRLGAILYLGKLYYRVRNMGLSKVDLVEVGYIDGSGYAYRLNSSISLNPGQIFTSAKSGLLGDPVAVYAITRRGNIFSGPVVKVFRQEVYDYIKIRTLLPSVHYVSLPTSIGSSNVASVNTFSYVFGFAVVKDLSTEDSVLIEFGPYNIASFFKTCSSQPNCRPSFSETKSDARGSVSASARFIFAVAGTPPEFIVSMPLSAQSTRRGIFVRGCVGMLWRTMSNTFFSFSEPQELPGWFQKGSSYYYSDDFEVLMFPSSVSIDMKSIISNLGKTTWEHYQLSEPPIGSVIEVYLVRCFTIIDRNLQKVEFSPGTHPSFTTPTGRTIWTSLIFPGVNMFSPSNVNISEVRLGVRISIDAAIAAIVES